MAATIVSPTPKVVPFPIPSFRRSVAVRLAERLYTRPSRTVSLILS